MKKSLIIVGICLTLTGTSALAECTQTGGCPIVQNENCCDKVYKPCPIKTQTCKKKPKCYTDNLTKYQNYVNKTRRERATVYNALDLTEEQIQQREKIVKENEPIFEEKFEQLKKEGGKLRALKKADASNREITKQNKAVKKIKNDIQKLLDKENKQFKKSLTHEQCSKYAIIKKLERKDYKDSCHQKDLYKANPKMRPFGNPQTTCPYNEEK